MEFWEKLQELRKNRGLTQEEVAEALFVSRTAVSKWESGRGYPNIDSLKAISSYFSVSIDSLLSGEKLLTIAENESKSEIRTVCSWFMGMVDLLYLLMIFLPLYPKTAENVICSVNLFGYEGITAFHKTVYWIVYLLLVFIGVMEMLLAQLKLDKAQKYLMSCSILLGILAELLPMMAREPYAAALCFGIILVKGALLLKIKY